MTKFAGCYIIRLKMKFRHILTIGAIAAISLIGCKKDETTVYESFNGSVKFELQSYVSPGDVIRFHPSGLSREDGESFGFSWKITPFMSKADTIRTENDPLTKSIDYVFTVPDTLCSFTVYAYAFAKGYTGTSTNHTAMIVNPERGTSLKGMELREGDSVFVDPRDNKDYYVAKIGNTEWFRENLAYEGFGKSYENASVFAKVFGCYYNWDEAVQACPDGWRLPSQEDWLAAARICAGDANAFEADGTFEGMSGGFMMNALFNDERMWEFWPAVKITDKLGFSAIPMGYSLVGRSGDVEFSGVNEYASFWTSNEYDEEQGQFRYIYVADPDVLTGSASKEGFYASIRCVRDVTE